MTRPLIDDCFYHDSERLRHDEAVAILKARLTPTVAVEHVPIAAATGRILAEPVFANMAVPAHTNSAVDGYAFAVADAAMADGDGLPVLGRVPAGHAGLVAAPHSAIRVFTGAALPTGHDTVAMQEDCRRFDRDGRAHVRIPAGLRRGSNVRQAGEDVVLGARLAEPGTRLRPQDVAALASVGLGFVPAFRRLRVAVLSSGDEIVAPGRGLAPGQVYDANAPMLHGLLALTGAEVSMLGIVADTIGDVRAQLSAAAGAYDVIIASGGASQGEEDHLVAALDAIGKRHLWQLAIKPGRPMSFGQIRAAEHDCVVVGLPGNPVAAFVCFLIYVFPMIQRLSGAIWPSPRRWTLPAAFAVPHRKTGRREFWRGILADAGNAPAVDKFARDGSGLISGLRAADGLIEVPEDVGAIAVGDPISFIPFTEFGIPSRSL